MFGGNPDTFCSALAWKRPSARNPPFIDKILLQTVEWAIKSALRWENTYHYLVVPGHNTSWKAHLDLLQHPACHTICTFPPGTLTFECPHTLTNKLVLDTANWEVLIVLVATRETLQNHALVRTNEALKLYCKENKAMYKQPREKSYSRDYVRSRTWDEKNSKKNHVPLQRASQMDAVLDTAVSWELPNYQEGLTNCLARNAMPVKDNFLTSSVKHACKEIENLPIGPLDHNKGMASVACPVYVHNQMLQTFTNDDRHFEKSEVTGRELLKRWKKFYDKNDLKKYQNWPKKNTELARPYILLKDKNIERNRPIVPYCQHPLKTSLNMASRALTFMLEHSDINSYNLPKVQDFKRVVRKVNRLLKQDPDLKVHPRGGDKKNMFSELPHDTVLEALDWVFARFAEKNHTDCVSLQRTGTQGVFMGRSRMAGWLAMDVRLLLQFDIENCYYRVGDAVVKQVHGVPMGSPPSPAVASAVMQFFEHPFPTEDLPQLLSVECESSDHAEGCRFADDKLDFFITTDETGYTADSLWESTSNIYHESMTMEDTPLDDLRFKFIGYDR